MCGIIKVIFMMYILSQMFDKHEQRENMYCTKISTFTIFRFKSVIGPYMNEILI